MSLDKTKDTILQLLGDSDPGRDIAVHPTRFITTKNALIFSFKEYFLSTYGAWCQHQAYSEKTGTCSLC